MDTPYHGALYDRLGGHMHPLNYTLGLARAAVAAGVAIHENSVAVSLDRTNGIRSPRRRARCAPGTPCWPATRC